MYREVFSIVNSGLSIDRDTKMTVSLSPNMHTPQVKVALGKQVIITNSYWNRCCNLKLHTVSWPKPSTHSLNSKT